MYPSVFGKFIKILAPLSFPFSVKQMSHCSRHTGQQHEQAVTERRRKENPMPTRHCLQDQLDDGMVFVVTDDMAQRAAPVKHLTDMC